MAKRRLAVLFLAISIAITLPSLALAAVNPTPGGLVPCGVGSDPNIATQCEACNLVQLLQGIIMFLIGLSIPIAVAMFAWAGILYFTSGAGGTENISKAKNIFGSTLFGFGLAVSGWLIINTILFTILDKEQYPDSSWFHISCTALTRPINNTISGVLENSLGGAPTPSAEAPTFSESCPAGLTIKQVSRDIRMCVSADGKTMKAPTLAYDKPTLSTVGGSCSSFTSNTLLSCISSNESSCNPAIGSGVDIGADGNSVSWGLTQWNISANPVKCTTSGGTTVNLNCPAAFSGGAYTSKNHDTRVSDQTLFDKCVAWAQDPSCNLQMASNLIVREKGSIQAWGNAARNNCQ